MSKKGSAIRHRRNFRMSAGQSMVEFAMTLTAFLLLTFGAMQLAVIGNVRLVLAQLAYSGARYAAVNPTLNGTQVTAYVKGIAPQIVKDNGGANLQVTLIPNTAPRTFGTPLTLSVNYNIATKMFIPSSFFGLSLPASFSNVQSTMMSE